MRPILLPAILLGLAGCGPGAGPTVEGQPSATTDDGLSLSVVAIETGDDTVVEMVAVNGSRRARTLGRSYSPMTLTDASGQSLRAAEQAIEIPAYSSDRLRVAFAGRPTGDQMTLTAGDVTLTGLPTRATRFAAGSPPAVGALDAAQVNHPNGSTVRVTGVTFGERATDVQVEVVNGHPREIRLASGATSTRLQDPSGRVYPLVPAAANPDLSVPSGQTLRGTLRFAGRVAPDVPRLALQFNADYGGDDTYATRPRVRIDLPLAPPSE